LLFAGLAAVLLLFIVVVPALGVFATPQVSPEQASLQQGTIRRVLEERIDESERGSTRRQTLEVALEEQIVIVKHARLALDAGPGRLGAGDKVLVQASLGPDDEVFYSIADRVRTPSLLLLSLAFIALVLLIARVQGFFSLLGMAAGFLVIIRFIIPGILAGHDPVVISVIGALVVMLTTLYLSHGVNWKTNVALLGTGVCLAITATLATLSIPFATLSGVGTEEAAMVRAMSEGQINAQGLLLAGIIIGALGVLDDITVAQASAVFELQRANPLLGIIELYRRGMNVGRDHIASTVNTLLLAYAGASLPLLLLLTTQPEPFGVLLNREFLATEVVRTIVGSMAIVAAVPLTTLFAAVVAGRRHEL
jgi:uncharacterized membrane protein